MRCTPWLSSVILVVACSGSSNDELSSSVQQCTLDDAGDVCSAPPHLQTAATDEATPTPIVAGITYAISAAARGKHMFVVFTPITTGTHTLYFGDTEPIRVCDETALCASKVTDCGELHRAAQYALMAGEAYVIELEATTAQHPFMLHIAAPEPPPPPPPPGLKLGPKVFYSSTGTFVRDISVGDLNGDGAPEVAISNPDDAGGSLWVDIMRNDGAGAFSHAARVMTSAPRETLISDFDADGDNDIVGIASDLMGPLPNFFLHDDGNFMFTKTTWTPTLQYKGTLSGGDFDEDGIEDLVAVYVPGDTDTRSGFTILKMPAVTTLQEQDEPTAPTSDAIAGDFNGDGHQDVLVGSGTAPVVRLYLGDGTGRVRFDRELALPVLTRITKLVALDLDGNAATDFVAFGTASDGFGVEGGSVTFSSGGGFTTVQARDLAEGVAAADFDHDGIIDLVSGVPDAAASPDLVWWHGTGTNFTFGGLVPDGESNCCMAATDLNADGILDLVTVGHDANTPGIDVWLGTP
jgi:VCBS repeat protein/FG-GAP repeat protein